MPNNKTCILFDQQNKFYDNNGHDLMFTTFNYRLMAKAGLRVIRINRFTIDSISEE